MIKVSVPGKIHLLGEHVVVYGKPALLSAIDKRIYFSATKSREDLIVFNGESRKLNNLKGVLGKAILKKFPKKKIPKLKIEINSEIPIGYGLGSSAALSVGISTLLFTILGLGYDKDLIYEIAMEGEKIFHGNPSGADVATVLHGGLIWFRKETDFLKNITPLSFKIPNKINKFVLIDSGKPEESTKEMVELVNAKIKNQKSKFRKLFDDQEELTKQLLVALKDGDQIKLIQIIKEGERNLEKLGVVGKNAKNIIRKVESIGGAAKILGGGGVKKGSGMILAYHKNLNDVLKLADKNNWNILKILINQEGLKYASKS